MDFNNGFWEYLNKLAEENEIIIDRPNETRQPKYKELDCGYIKNAKATDGNKIDVLKGSLHNN